MHLAGSDLIFSATDVSGYLACSHLTTLDLEAAHGGPKPPKFPDPGGEALRQRGHEHESEILARYRDRGLDVAELEKPDWSKGRDGAWSGYAARTLEAMREGKDVIHQACLFDGQWLGLPDFLVRVDGESDLGDWAYEVVDAKLARSAKAGAVLQICFYSEMLERTQCRPPERMHLALGGGRPRTQPRCQRMAQATWRRMAAAADHRMVQPTGRRTARTTASSRSATPTSPPTTGR